jgi:polar amino acid transport system substrate-binding protein
MRSLIRSILPTLLTLLLFVSPHLLAEQAILKPLTIVTAAADPWPPYISNKHKSGGVSVQIANAALVSQGFKVTNQIVPWARAIKGTKDGMFDLILDAWWTQSRSRYFMYSRPYIDGPVKFIYRKGTQFEYHDLSNLKGKTIGLVRDYGYNDDFLNSTNYKQFQVTDFMQAVKMLVKGRIDLAVENQLVAINRIQQNDPALLPRLSFSKNPLVNNYVYVISSYKNPLHNQLIEAFNKGLEMILKNGTYKKILKENGLSMPEMFDNY